MDKKEKITYELDPFNRLIVKSGEKSDLKFFRTVIDGTFKIDKNNTLKYKAVIPSQLGTTSPYQLKLDGQWALDDDHNLKLTLNQRGRADTGDTLTFKGVIKDVKKNSLTFAVTTKTKEGEQSTYNLKLNGVWQVNKNNQLTFKVKKERGKHDLLTLNAAWQINKNHQLIYKYVTGSLIRKKKKEHTITFKGHWQITDKAKITYLVDHSSTSALKFKTGIGIVKDKSITYEIGIGRTTKDEPVKKRLVFYGNWKVKGKGKLAFEVEYDKGEFYELTFKVEAKLTDKNKIKLKLKNNKDEGLGAEIELSRAIKKGDGEAFVRLIGSKKETAALVGLGFRW